jgi:hypothetical protein
MRRSLMVAALGAGLFASGADAQQCETGAVELTAISQAEYEQLVDQAGGDACVTPRSSGVTVCQVVPGDSGGPWTVVAQAPEGGGDAVSAAELEVYTGQTCHYVASTPVESTDSRWVKAVTEDYAPEPVDEPQPVDFIAVLQIGPGNQTTATVCPFGDGYDGTSCEQWSGWQ